ncbi:MAG: hypothetical protein ACLP1X_19815 [Polyangiaceae bacterium]
MVRPLDRIGTSSAWLRDRLADAGARLHPASKLARALGNLDDLRGKALRNEVFSFRTTDAAYDFFASAVGADFLSKALHWGAECGFKLGVDRWRHLTSGNPIVTNLGAPSTERNLTWEVIIASLASTFAQDVGFDEPDVRCAFQGKTFAVAAKVAYSERSTPCMSPVLSRGPQRRQARGHDGDGVEVDGASPGVEGGRAVGA